MDLVAIFMMGEWHNAVIDLPFPSSPSFGNGLGWVMTGKSWAKPIEFMQSYESALSSPTMDPKLLYAVADVIAQDALLIPVYEKGEGWAFQSYVMGLAPLERGMTNYFNIEQTWLNK